ncbi:MAG: phospholipase C, phosphocholine-specific [Nevskia sp.]
MDAVDRRCFLRLAGASVGAAMVPAAIRTALAVPANHRTGSIRDVEHVVILMQENRSFDHYFGTLAGVRGYGDRFPVPLASGKPVWYQRDAALAEILPYHLDGTQGNAQRVTGTPHSWTDAHLAWNDGRYGYWPAFKEKQSMGYYTQAELPFQFALANAFTICDAYHAAIHSSTNPNRLFLFTGSNDPGGNGGGPAIDNTNDDLGPSSTGYGWTTYAERLEAAGVSWQVYQDLDDNFTDNPLEGFRSFRLAHETDPASPLVLKGLRSTLHNNSLDGLRADVLAGRLPQVSYIVGPAAYSEHPGPSSPVQGGWYAQAVLEALTADPEVWSKTVLLLCYDENDGFFDHLPPPSAHSIRADGLPAGASTVDDTADRHRSGSPVDNGWPYGPGPRVPMTVISPWSRGGWVNSEVFDHTSVIRFLEARFGVVEPNISARRRAICGDLSSCFNFRNPNDEVFPALPSSSREDADALRTSQEQRAQIAAPVGAAGRLPRQAAGLRPSRALPYELAVDAAQERLGLRLDFINSGRSGAVFHVYDQKQRHEIPRRYTVEAGKSLSGRWETLLPDLGFYDLWLLGPNGFHRRFKGSLAAQLPAAAVPEVRVRGEEGRLVIGLSNAGRSPCEFSIAANAYRNPAPRVVAVAGGERLDLRYDLKASGRWYDFTVTCAARDGFLRRFAGRLENGQPSFSDPAMGLA